MQSRAGVWIVLGIALFYVACSDSDEKRIEHEVVYEMDIAIGEDSVAIPEGNTECKSCHVIEELGMVQGDENRGIREWISAQGVGMVRLEPAFPVPGLHLIMHWPERGRHADEDLDETGCTTCHPTTAEGIGHGSRAYPDDVRDTVFKGGQDCAESCHLWLKDAVTAQGLTGDSGSASVYQGSMRPVDLLEAHDSLHAQLWNQGARPVDHPMKISAFNAGCGGCHNVAEESHGTIPTCIGCHKLTGTEGVALRNKIVGYIEAHQAQLDPDNAGIDPCGYCHTQDGVPTERSNAVCYNCHLSAHQPLNAEGKPHFWVYQQ